MQPHAEQAGGQALTEAVVTHLALDARVRALAGRAARALRGMHVLIAAALDSLLEHRPARRALHPSEVDRHLLRDIGRE